MRFSSSHDDERARFNDLYARFGAAIYARCRQILKDRAAAEDVTQETFLSAHRTLARLGNDREALAWLYRTATNRCLNEIRNGRYRPVSVANPPDLPDWPLDQQLVNHDLFVRLTNELPQDLSTVAWLYHVDGHEQADIADICGVSRRTIISRLARFAQRARALLQRIDHESAG
jgi:RNA polymerase sigma-70 factor, ECF subfamily